jgi:hypothetical protein
MCPFILSGEASALEDSFEILFLATKEVRGDRSPKSDEDVWRESQTIVAIWF